jgi:hypothetical protein
MLCCTAGMLWLIVAMSAFAGAVLWIWSSLHRAPEGYEDEKGFHLMRRRAHGSRVLAKKRDAHAESVVALKRTKA